jgi:hypothetical protein
VTKLVRISKRQKLKIKFWHGSKCYFKIKERQRKRQGKYPKYTLCLIQLKELNVYLKALQSHHFTSNYSEEYSKNGLSQL